MYFITTNVYLLSEPRKSTFIHKSLQLLTCNFKSLAIEKFRLFETYNSTWASAAGGRGDVDPWIYIHDTDKVEWEAEWC